MTPRLRARTWPIDDVGPLLAHLPSPAGFAWLRGDDGLVGWGETARVHVDGRDRFRDAADRWRELAAASEVIDDVAVRGSGLVAFGSFTFDHRSHGSSLAVPAVVVGRHEGRAFVTAITADGRSPTAPELDPRPTDPGPLDRPRYAGASIPDVLWLDAVAEAVDRIEAGSIEKVVLARDYAVWSRTPFDPRVLAARLNARFPSCLTFAVDGLVGATPELLVRRSGAAVESLALAGTARRGADAQEDQRIGAELLGSDKDRREHQLAAATVETALGPHVRDLAWSDEPHLLRLDNLMHLATRFRGRVEDPATVSALDLAAALHPTAAVGGTPTDVAVEAIRELEGMDRGRYAGPVGWIDADGDGEWGIALRCAELSGARARLFAGAGIVRGSLPESELEETRVKLQAMQSAFDQ